MFAEIKLNSVKYKRLTDTGKNLSYKYINGEAYEHLSKTVTVDNYKETVILKDGSHAIMESAVQ